MEQMNLEVLFNKFPWKGGGKGRDLHLYRQLGKVKVGKVQLASLLLSVCAMLYRFIRKLAAKVVENL